MTTAESVLSQTDTGRARSGKYLTFILADESYGLEILKVREIIGTMDITPVPRTPVYVKGVINLRGSVIPVVDLRVKFGLESAETTDETCIIVVDVQDSQTGIFVDNVDEVLDIGVEDIEDAPDFGAAVELDYILGVAKVETGIKILLNIEEVLTDQDIIDMASACKSNESEEVKTVEVTESVEEI